MDGVCPQLEEAKRAALALLPTVLPPQHRKIALDGSVKFKVQLRSDKDESMPLSGGSLGLSIAMALSSLVLQRRILCNVSSTGGLDELSGALDMVGGLREKIGASRDDLRPNIFIPYGCELSSPRELRYHERLKVFPVLSLEQAIEFVFNLKKFD